MERKRDVKHILKMFTYLRPGFSFDTFKKKNLSVTLLSSAGKREFSLEMMQ